MAFVNLKNQKIMSDSNLERTEAASIKLEDFIEAATRGAIKALEAQSTNAAGQTGEIKFPFPYVTIGIVWRPPTGEDPYNQGSQPTA